MCVYTCQYVLYIHKATAIELPSARMRSEGYDMEGTALRAWSLEFDAARSLTLDAFGFKRAEPFIYACENIFNHTFRAPVHNSEGQDWKWLTLAYSLFC